MGRRATDDLRLVAAHPLVYSEHRMTSKLELDSRIDPRIKAYFAGSDMPVTPDVSSLLASRAAERPHYRPTNRQLFSTRQ
jgi:hypothetical protein